MNNQHEIAGVQFDLTNVNIESAGDGTSGDYYSNVSFNNNRILAFSMDGSTIPSSGGSDILFTKLETSGEGEICF